MPKKESDFLIIMRIEFPQNKGEISEFYIFVKIKAPFSKGAFKMRFTLFV